MLVTVLAAGGIAACGDDVATPVDVAGVYRATLFETTTDGTTTDEIANGALMTINLVADLTMTGRLFFPGGNLDADMAGDWTLLRNSIQMDQEADTFVRDIDWVVIPGGTLTGTGVFSGVQVNVILEREQRVQ